MKPNKLYTGNTLTQDNFNNIIETIRGLENREVQINNNEQVFIEGDDLAGSRITFTRNAEGEINSFSVDIYETTDRTPFYSEDGVLFESEAINNVLIDSDFQVIRGDNGELVNGTLYGLSTNGAIVFNEPHNEMKILVSGLNYRDQKTYFIGRDKVNRGITRISMNPVEDTADLVEQPLYPKVILDEKHDVVAITNTDDLDTNIFRSALATNYFTDGLGSPRNFILDLKEEMIVKRYQFSYQRINQTNYASVDIWGSKDGTNWTRLKKLRNFTQPLQTGEMDIVGSFRYIKFDTFHLVNTSNIYHLRAFMLWGYHPEGKDLLTEDKIGSNTFVDVGTDTGIAYNERVSVKTNATSERPNDSNYDPNKFKSPKLFLGSETFSNALYHYGDNPYIEFEFNEPTEVKRIRFKHRNIIEWVFEGSTDGETWKELTGGFIITGDLATVSVIDKPITVKHYRFRVLTKSASTIEINNRFMLE